MKTHQRQTEFIPPGPNSPIGLMESYLQWKAQLEPLAPAIESRRNSQGSKNLEGSSSSHNWEEVYLKEARPRPPEQSVITMSPLLYRLMLEQGHVSELVNLQIRLRRESWSHYFVRVIRRLSQIDQLP